MTPGAQVLSPAEEDAATVVEFALFPTAQALPPFYGYLLIRCGGQ